jgi:hypothetical protein
MINEADIDKSGTVNCDEFITVFKVHKDDPDPRGWGRLKMWDSIGGTEIIEKIVDAMYNKI